MTSFARRKLHDHERTILIGLANFYYESGYRSDAYRDDATGGMYENKLANRLGFRLAPDDRSPPEFLEACRALEARGYVRRRWRDNRYKEMGVWPTFPGLDYADYLKASAPRKVWIRLSEQWPSFLISFVTAVITTFATITTVRLLGLFGLAE